MFAEKFDQAKLLADARAIDGLEDFGDPVFYRSLEVLLKDLAQAPLNKLGANILSAGIVRSLANRLRLNAWFSRHPEIANEEIIAPAVVVGGVKLAAASDAAPAPAPAAPPAGRPLVAVAPGPEPELENTIYTV